MRLPVPGPRDVLAALERGGDQIEALIGAVPRMLALLDVAVRSAHVDTLGPQAVDVFYLQEVSAGSLTDERAAQAAHAVRAALGPAPG